MYVVVFLSKVFNHLLPIPVADVIKENWLGNWSDMTRIQKPIIAAVSGFAVSAS